MSILSGHFDFIGKFEKLVDLRLLKCEELSLNFAAKLLNELESMRTLVFDSPDKVKNRFYFSLSDDSEITLSVRGSKLFKFKIPGEKPAEFLKELSSRLKKKADGLVCPQELLVLLRKLQLKVSTSS